MMENKRDTILFQYIVDHLDRIWGSLSPCVKRTILSWDNKRVFSLPDLKEFPLEDVYETLESGTKESILDCCYDRLLSILLFDLSSEDKVIIIQDVLRSPNLRATQKFKEYLVYYKDEVYFVINNSMRDILDDVMFHVDFVHFLSLIVFEKFQGFKFKPGPIEKNMLEKIADHTIKYAAGACDGGGYVICEKL